jgi:predicted kinase
MRRYMDLAYRYAIQFSLPMLWVMCGQVASGKSTIASALADSLCIGCLRSDVVRKELFESSNLESGEIPFGEGIYSQEATSLTYGRLLLLAQREIEEGRSVVLDATFGRKYQRREALRLAAEMGAAIVFIVCGCSEATIRKRLHQRAAGDSVSDARIQHLDQLQAAFETPDDLSDECLFHVDTENPVEENLQTIFTYTATPNNCLERGWLPR